MSPGSSIEILNTLRDLSACGQVKFLLCDSHLVRGWGGQLSRFYPEASSFYPEASGLYPGSVQALPGHKDRLSTGPIRIQLDAQHVAIRPL